MSVFSEKLIRDIFQYIALTSPHIIPFFIWFNKETCVQWRRSTSITVNKNFNDEI